MRLAELTWPKSRDAFAAGAVAILPVGATEAHGPHLPLDTDVHIAVGAANRAAALLASEGTPALVLPPLAIGLFALIAYGLVLVAVMMLPETRGKQLLAYD